MNQPKPFDGRVSLNQECRKWSVVQLLEYPYNGLCEAGGRILAIGIQDRKTAKEWAENQGYKVIR